MSHHLWQGRFGGDPSIVGKTIEMNKRAVTVVGVTAPGFRGTEVALVSDFWAPLSMLMEVGMLKGHSELTDRTSQWLLALGRLRDGVSSKQALAETDVIAKRIATQFPDSHKDRTFHIEVAGQLNPAFRGMVVIFFSLLMSVTMLVLLTACANVANLLLARASARRKEIATRLAIGAGRGRLLRQLLTESVLLALAGGVGGYVLASWGRPP